MQRGVCAKLFTSKSGPVFFCVCVCFLFCFSVLFCFVFAMKTMGFCLVFHIGPGETGENTYFVHSKTLFLGECHERRLLPSL